MDRRVKYTRMVLNESLIRFLQQKDISKITVTELCADADINRSTYYVHYTDPYNQLAQLKNELLHDLAAYAAGLDTDGLADSERVYRVLKSILQYVESKRKVFRILLAQSGDHQLQHDILSILGEKAFPADWIQSTEKRRWLMIYAANGCFGIFYKWLMAEDTISCDELARLMADFTRYSVIAGTGTEE